MTQHKRERARNSLVIDRLLNVGLCISESMKRSCAIDHYLVDQRS